MTKIKAKKNLYNIGKCFTKGRIYEVDSVVRIEPSLMELSTVNDQSQIHCIGSWWRNFEIVR
jgi:hypothetical protein